MRSFLPLLALIVTFGLCLSCRSTAPPVGSPVAGVQTTLPVLTDELQSMRKAGLPTSPEDLQAPLPPAGQNAAPLYRQLVALVKARPVAADDKIATDGVGRRMLTAERAKRLRKAFQHRADIGRLIHRAADRRQCVFERKWSQGAAMMFPELVQLRVAARWLSAESALQLYDGKPLDALKSATLGFHLGRHAARDPTLIAYLVAYAIDAISLASLERILYAPGDGPGVAEAVRQTLEAGWQPHSLAYGLHGEMILPIVEFEKNRHENPEAYERGLREVLKEEGEEAPPPLSPEDRGNWSQYVDRSELVMLRSLHRLITVADRSYPESQPVLQNVLSDLRAHQRDATYIFARIVIPVYEQSVKRHAQLWAKVAVIEAAATILAWKARHGTFPAKLADAMARVPLDPFDGKALRYKKEGTGFVVYSAGPTGAFSGGNPSAKPGPWESLFRYPMPVYVK